MTFSRSVVLAALRQLPTDALRWGMAAFTHVPRMKWQPVGDDHAGCFCWEAFYAHGVTPQARDIFVVVLPLSHGYECDTEWFKGECVRELAERGAAPEPAVGVVERKEAPCLAIT